MRRIVMNRLRLQWARYVLICLCVAVSAAFATASLMLNSTMNASLVGSLAESTKNADLVLAPKTDDTDTLGMQSFPSLQEVKDLKRIDGIAEVWSPAILLAAVKGQETTPEGTLGLSSAPEQSTLFPWEVTEGSLPTQDGEVLLAQSRAEALELKVGDSFTVESTDYYGQPAETETGTGQQPAPTQLELTVVGLAETRDATTSADGWLTTSQLTAVSPSPEDQMFPNAETQVLLDPGADQESVREAIRTTMEDAGHSVEVLTPQEQSDRILERISGESNMMLAFLLAFALLSAIVAFLVITNTFGVLTAQRARELALLRCLGATGGQLRRSVLVEALVIGVVSSIVGITVTVGVGFALDLVLPSWVMVAVSTRDILCGLGLGVGLTLLASLSPARRAMQASPLDGMRGSRANDRLPVVRTAVGTILLIGGVSTLVWAALVQDQIIAGFASAAAAAVGLILTARLWMPSLVSCLGRLMPGKTPSALAAAHAARHPGRTTTTATALLIGVTLVSTVLTGHMVAQRSILEHLDNTLPVDVTITDTLDAQTVEAVATTEHVVSVSPVDGETHVDLEQGIGPWEASDTVTAIANATGTDPWQIGQVALEKAAYVGILNIMLTVALGLLGASVLVSVLGIASTMSLSVLERTRENSLLRALGLSRNQLGATIRREALLIAAAACVVGVTAGWLLGFAVVRSMVTDSIPTLPAVPWVGFIGVAIGGWVTAMLAAALPARRAIRVSPVEGLASID